VKSEIRAAVESITKETLAAVTQILNCFSFFFSFSISLFFRWQYRYASLKDEDAFWEMRR